MNYDDDSDREPCDIDDVKAIEETDLAIMVEINGSDYWIPKSLIATWSEVKEKNDEGTLVIPVWKARQLEIA